MITIEIIGLDKVIAGLQKFPAAIARNLTAAGEESARRVILPTEGLQKYPPPTEANRPPTPYYIRGQGMQYASGNKGNSERLGSQFWVAPEGYLSTAIGNRASYADYVVGEGQAGFMGAKGWRKLIDVANEKIPEITKVFQAWVDKTIQELGL